MRIISIYDSSICPPSSVYLQQKLAAFGANTPAAFEVTQTNRLQWPPSSDKIQILMRMILVLDETATLRIAPSLEG
jgi:hypothetical protein